jgi:hypothetical protein
MDKDTQATLHHSRVGRVDKMTAGGRLEDMVLGGSGHSRRVSDRNTSSRLAGRVTDQKR